MRETGGFQGLFETIYGLTGTINAFDSFGHFTRAVIPTNVCFDYTSIEQSSCGAKFTDQAAGPSRAGAVDPAMREPIETGAILGAEARETSYERRTRCARRRPADDEDAAGDDATDDARGRRTRTPATAARRSAMRDLLDFMIGAERGGRR